LGLSDGRQLAMIAWAVGMILYLYKMTRDVNKKLEQLGQRPLTERDYGGNFVQGLFREHERLFPESSQRMWWIITFLLSGFLFIIIVFV